jgi:hypothetical protein
MPSIDHTPQGNPCSKCGKNAAMHRVEHRPRGMPCILCGLPWNNHRFNKAGNEYKARKKERRSQGSDLFRVQLGRNIYKRKEKPHFTYLGIDGEGQGRKHHLYTFLACSDEYGEIKESVGNENGLSTRECFDFILDLPNSNHKIFAYAFNYDLTKILTDLDNQTLYMLFRPELRQRPAHEAVKGPYAVLWNGYKLNYQGTKFTLQDGGGKRVVIWDIFKFFQAKFVGAIKDWKVGNPELWERMQKMKDQRAEFDRLNFEQVKCYCFEECACMAELARKLTEAHKSAGLKLRSYYGAGSSASAMLNVMGIRKQIVNPSKEMSLAISSAFFGGRFENSVIGPIQHKVYNYDISSAYPYQLFFLPCLQHTKWMLSRSRNDLEKPDVSSAIVHYELEKSYNHPNFFSWGPFPFRESNGSICFPEQSGGGWVYKDEYLQGEKLFPGVVFKEAWVGRKDCECIPFQRIPGYYLERLKLGKEGPGIVIKLGCNSCYGKLAQSVGNALFNSWLWAGMITSGTRAQILEMLGLHHEWKNLLMMATDGIYTREQLQTPIPKDTGTFGVSKPLGGWEEKAISKGVFVARPGIYFPMNPTTEELKDVRGRGVGKGVILENWEKIVNAWPPEEIHKTMRVSNVTRFCGAKSSVSRSGTVGGYRYKRADGTESEPSYGQWITREVRMSFNPMPKRLKVHEDDLTLELRSLPRTLVTTPYNRCAWSEESLELRACEAEAVEQPDGDLTDYQ